MSPSKRAAYLALGSLCLLLAGIGIIFPVLPTTPFLLLASYLFARSSERVNTWLVSNRVFGEYIRRYRLGLGVSVQHKIISIALLWLTILYAAWVVDAWWLKILLVAIAGAVSYHLARMKTYRPHAPGSQPRSEGSTQQEIEDQPKF